MDHLLVVMIVLGEWLWILREWDEEFGQAVSGIYQFDVSGFARGTASGVAGIAAVGLLSGADGELGGDGCGADGGHQADH